MPAVAEAFRTNALMILNADAIVVCSNTILKRLNARISS